jgi:hypothetical protein
MKTLRYAVILPMLLLAACDDGNDNDLPTAPAVPASPAPSVTGTWSTSLLVQFRREHDGYAGTYTCPGQMTLTQTNNSFRGFMVINPPCGATSTEVSGSVQPNGDVSLTGAGPRPGAGTCPPPPTLTYAGLMTTNQISVRATSNVDCPGEGEGRHRFDFILTGFRSSR